MKLSDVSTKLTCIKSTAVRVLSVAALAGAVLTAAAPAAQAQHVSFGIQVGGPRYVAPAPVYYGQTYGPGYYDQRRIQEYREREAHEAWLRQQEYDRQRFEHERWEREHFDARDHRFDQRFDDRSHDYDRDHRR